MQTINSGWPLATRQPTATSSSSADVSAAPSGTVSAPPKVLSSSPAKRAPPWGRSVRDSRGSRSTTPPPSKNVPWRSSTNRVRWPMPMRPSVSWSISKGQGSSRATTTTPAPRRTGCVTGCSGPEIWPTAMPMGGSTSPAVPLTGCGSTERTWPPHPSSGSCCDYQNSIGLPCTRFPTSRSATR